MPNPGAINVMVNVFSEDAKVIHPVFESCREELGKDHNFNRCGERAEFLFWGKLFPPEALGPRCYFHACNHTSPANLYGKNLEQAAILDLRRLYRTTK